MEAAAGLDAGAGRQDAQGDVVDHEQDRRQDDPAAVRPEARVDRVLVLDVRAQEEREAQDAQEVADPVEAREGVERVPAPRRDLRLGGTRARVTDRRASTGRLQLRIG